MRGWAGSDGQGREVIDAAEAAEPLDPRSERLEIEQGAEILFDGAETRDGFIDGAQIRAMGVIERRDRPGLCPQPDVVPFGPGLLGGREAPAVAEEEFREAMPRAQEIGADVFATAQQIAGRLFLLGGNVNGRERPGAIEHRELPGITAIGLDAIAGAPRNERGRDDVARNAAGREGAL